jgi:hypothetical protein
MNNNKQQTAVEWLAEKTFNQIELLKHSCISEEQFLNNMLIFREQAKEMEKERLTDAYCDGKANGMDISHPLSLTKQISAEEYYNETFGGGEQ